MRRRPETFAGHCDGSVSGIKLRDYGRIDMRLNDKGEIYVIEANPNPWLASADRNSRWRRKSRDTLIRN